MCSLAISVSRSQAGDDTPTDVATSWAMDRSSTAMPSPRRASTSRSEAIPSVVGTRRTSSSSSRVPSRSAWAAASSEAASAAQPDVRAGDAPFEVSRGTLGDDAAPVKHRDAAGELVGLLQVLRGEQNGDALGDEIADELPHGVAAARVQAGGGLVEDHGAHRIGLAVQIVPQDAGRAGVGRDQGGQDPHDGGLARTVGIAWDDREVQGY